MFSRTPTQRMGTPTRAEAWCGAKAGAMVPPALSHSQQNPGRNMTVKAKAALSFDNKKAAETKQSSAGPVITKSFSSPWKVPEEAEAQVLELLKSGDLFRYNRNNSDSLVSYLECAVAEYTGHKYSLAVNSGGSAIFLALMAAGVKPGDKVLSNALTFGAVPSAIHHCQAECIMVESKSDYVVDIVDLKAKCAANPDAKFFLISHMRGRLADMDAVARICNEKGIVIIEDCAHSLGVFWDGMHSGHKGVAACISTQSYKLLNSGEGGLVLTNDDVIAAKCIIAAGGYEKLYLKHKATPPAEVFESCGKLSIPNYSLRMNNLSAAVLLPQVKLIDERRQLCNRRYSMVATALETRAKEVGACIEVPGQHPKVDPCSDSLQFNLQGYTFEQVQEYVKCVKARGVPVAIFGAPDNARNYRTWHFLGELPELAQTDRVIKFAIDVRLPPEFTDGDFEVMCECLVAGLVDIGPPGMISNGEILATDSLSGKTKMSPTPLP